MDTQKSTVPRNTVEPFPVLEATGAVPTMPLSFTVNGTEVRVQVDPRTSLLDVLRETLGLTGTKKGCDHGQCGACTVHVGGERIVSCLSLALVHQGDSITTIEGLAHGDVLSPVQAAFLQYDAYQCGYCTSGQIMSATALLDEVSSGQPSHVTADVRAPGPFRLTPEEIKERMSGNLCRCAAYPGIVAAVAHAYCVHSPSICDEGDVMAACNQSQKVVLS